MVGVVTPAVLRRVRRYARWNRGPGGRPDPSGDPFTLLVLSVPMLLFYEIAILVGVLRNRRRPVEAQRPFTWTDSRRRP
ncbi:MAG: hypothetical protein Ct9H300mP12_13760 [Acidimicrobiales bacterium]|nr:MAG: hypothetical protein Ct9H300mP12_13760 [Acidimicrobiales bacterium]